MNTKERDYGPNPWRDPGILDELYYECGLSQAGVADVLGCTNATVSRWMDKHDIPIKDARGKGDLTASDTPCPFYTLPDANGSGCINYYEFWQDSYDGVKTRVPIHRLLAVAEYGFDAVKDKVIHHKNWISWDNRPSNLQLLSRSAHTRVHSNKTYREYRERSGLAALDDKRSAEGRGNGE